MLYEKNGEIEMKLKLNMKRGLVFLLILTLMSSVMPFALAEESDGWIIKPAPNYTYYVQHNYSLIYKGNIYTFGGGPESKSSTVYNRTEMYDPSTNEWYEKASIPVNRARSEIVLLDNKAYIVGGTNNGDALVAYDFESNTWEKKASMSYATYALQMEVINGEIYTVGGLNSSSLEVYNPKSDHWESKAKMSTERSYFQTEVVNGKLYALGGTGKDRTILNSVEVYDPQNDTWTRRAPMPTNRTKFRSELINGKIYAIGGMDSSSHTNKVDVYDPLNDTWEQLSPMEIARSSFQTISVSNQIYAIGGNTGNTHTMTVEKYDVSTNEWKSLQSMHENRSSSVQIQKLSNMLFVFGGSLSKRMEAYTIANFEPTLTVTASPNKVKVGNRFTTTVAIHNVSNIYAEDIKIDYDAERFEYLGASAKDGLKIYKEDTSKPGSVRFIVAHLGKDSGATGDKDLIELTFKAKSVGIGKVDITKGRIADNDVLEMDVSEENCGEDTIEVEANKDVNRNGEYTLLDLGIDAYYYGLQADQTDTTRFDTDVIPDGVIDEKDLTAITQSILDNSNYPSN